MAGSSQCEVDQMVEVRRPSKKSDIYQHEAEQPGPISLPETYSISKPQMDENPSDNTTKNHTDDGSEDSSKHSQVPSASEEASKGKTRAMAKKQGLVEQKPSKGGGKSRRKPSSNGGPSQDVIDEIIAKKFFGASSKPKRKKRSKPGRKGSDSERVAVVIQSSPPLLEKISEESWSRHFNEFLPEITDVSYFHPEENEEYHIRVVFDSSSSAIKAISTLNSMFLCGDHKLSLQLEIPDQTTKPQVVVDDNSGESSIECEKDKSRLLKHVAAKKKECAEKRMRDVARLKEMLSTPVKAPVKTIEKIIEEKNARLKFSIEQCILHREVFLKCCDHIEDKLEGHTTMERGDIDSLRASFDREMKRYKKNLPIYSHRLNIMETIEKHQVCIVIGDTGAGKSTQIVQYLSEAGYASNGLIVCTQPWKLAAISLAERVSMEANEEVGETYGYLTSSSKRGTKTEVLYTTDHTLLNECIADPTLSKYSCLVIDEAQERTIYTDILIALVKRCLSSRHDLKVIISSATINPVVFSSYFGGPHLCPVVKIPSLIYPVEVSWKGHRESMIDRDYLSEAVNKVRDIHAEGEPGDVLVFLTCPAETERACELAKDVLKNEALVLPLHDKIQLEGQSKIFSGTQKRKRKVIFSTSVAETSVMIPDIVYVIDTGLSKELCHDPINHVNSFELRAISKSSADQRMGIAGSTSLGECHRLYSREDYADMQVSSTPEIFQSALTSAVLKLYKFGIRDFCSFEFVESPDKRVLDYAIERLKFLGAVKDGELTGLGEKMAFLSIDPSLSKVLFDAINKGLGAPAAAAVAISTLAGRVFFSSYSSELQNIKDKKRPPFFQQSGDQMTYLHAYYEWFQQGRKKNTWCTENHINASSMLMVKHIIEELRLVLKQECNTKIQSDITLNSLTKADKIIPKLFFDAFLQNMCMHLGHHQAGYWSEELPDEQLLGSFLHYLSPIPQCVVYEKIHKTNGHCLLQALPVHEEWIQEAIESGKLLCHPTQGSWFKCYRLYPHIFTNLGPSVMSKLQQEYPHSGNVTISNLEIQPVFEYLNHQGLLRVFAQQEHQYQICKSITDYIALVRKELKHESCKHSLAKFNDDVMVVIGVGGCIQDILIHDNYQAVVVRGLSQMLVPEVEERLKRYGPCLRTDTSYREQGVQLYVQYSNPDDAERALQHHFYRILRHREFNKNPSTLTVQWWRRKREAIIQFVAMDPQLQDYLSHCTAITDDESGLNFNPTQKKGSILISEIRNSMTEDEIKQRLLDNFPLCNEAKFSLTFNYSKAFNAYSDLYGQLDAFLAERAKKCDYRINFSRPKPEDIFYRASITFEDPILCSVLFRRLCGEQR